MRPDTLPSLSMKILRQAFEDMMKAKAMSFLYDEKKQICKYVHSNSRGHEAIQLATAYHLQKDDWISPYYRDESLLLGMGYTPYQLMLQLLAKGEDIFSGGRSYYIHPSRKTDNTPKIIHQSSATGMQAIPTTGIAQGIQYIEHFNLQDYSTPPVVVCSFGDNSITEGEVSEAFQFAGLHQLPILFLVQDNDWGISTTAEEARAQDAYEFISGFKGIQRMRVDGTDFIKSYTAMNTAFAYVRNQRKPLLVCAKTVLIGHHTSGVRKEMYRPLEDLAKHETQDPGKKLRTYLLEAGYSENTLYDIEKSTEQSVRADFQRALEAKDPAVEDVNKYVFAPTPITEEQGEREPKNGQKILMIDAAIHAIQELMSKNPEALLYGQDVGERIGGVFRETVTLATKFGSRRVFNTPIQEAYIIGSTVGMSAVGLKPIVEIQFADYIYTGINQLITEISKSCYLSLGKFPVSTVIRVPIGAYGGGGPYHSGSIESLLASIKGIKIAYPSNAADFKGLFKAAFYDPNPVILLEHKGLYWSKVAGTQDAQTVEPAENYILPLGQATSILKASEEQITKGLSLCIITYGMGIYWAKEAAKHFTERIEIVDLRSLIPLDEAYVYSVVQKHGKCIVLTEEQLQNSFAEALSARISQACFKYLDAPVTPVGALNIPAIPLNINLEREALPNAEKLKEVIHQLFAY
ncbi:tungsten formylmethanofuran dehydrogenase [Elizabethkingia argentiflava]|uniref:3-methyl-2-oxobutanoate dehydrogenase (2-methylpropanoyl-transferring) n=1 Tax=Elizabethkingia argenteiflava TaxID=2681556 RepID=A0A845PV87_9FLAO|nr:alpha-ketoacid dehydrogenase subunit alpha/beta [Elizabethkingia argenteiflava]NAW50891.1 tungsten formylmethanofuran dehydrogenase [Elizabethkingia argenteiflava]